MAMYDGSKKIRHYFPKVNHTIENYEDFDDFPDTMIINNRHDLPYIGDFPPKDDYKEHRFY